MDDLIKLKANLDLEYMLIEVVTSCTELEDVDYRLYSEAVGDTRFHDFLDSVQHTLGGMLSTNTYRKIDWEFVASYWWDKARQDSKEWREYLVETANRWEDRSK